MGMVYPICRMVLINLGTHSLHQIELYYEYEECSLKIILSWSIFIHHVHNMPRIISKVKVIFQKHRILLSE